MSSRARVYLVRHGETDANRKRIITGQLDIPLNKVGLEQAASVAIALRTIKFDVVLTSDLSRAKETAAVIVGEQPRVVLQEQEELRERFMGELQGQVYGTKVVVEASTMETIPALAERTLTWWKKNIVEHTASLASREEPYNVLAVSHGGFLGTLMKSLVAGGDVGVADGVVLAWLDNASVSLIEWDGQKGKIIRYSGGEHLRPTDLRNDVNDIPN